MAVLDDGRLDEASLETAQGQGWVTPPVVPGNDHDLIDSLLSAQEPGVLTLVILSGALPGTPGCDTPCTRLAMRLTLSSLADLSPSSNALLSAAANMPVAFDRSASQVVWTVTRARSIDRQARLTETSSLLQSVADSMRLPCAECAASTSSATTRSTLFFDAISDVTEGQALGTAVEYCEAMTSTMRETLLPTFSCFHLSSVYKIRVFVGESVENPPEATRVLNAIGVKPQRASAVAVATRLL